MYLKNDKRRLYWLMKEYLSGKINEQVFCDEFYYSYSLEIDKNSFSELEVKVFEGLDEVSSRFSEFESDHKLDPKAFYNEEQLKSKIIWADSILSSENSN